MAMARHEMTNGVFRCWPGSVRAGAARRVDDAGGLVLSVFLDPVTVVITEPPFPGGAGALCRFLRGLAREAWAAADEIDPSGLPSITDRPDPAPVVDGSVSEGPRHRLDPSRLPADFDPWSNPDKGV
jgi:hypothetical protein